MFGSILCLIWLFGAPRRYKAITHNTQINNNNIKSCLKVFNKYSNNNKNNKNNNNNNNKL